MAWREPIALGSAALRASARCAATGGLRSRRRRTRSAWVYMAWWAHRGASRRALELDVREHLYMRYDKISIYYNIYI